MADPAVHQMDQIFGQFRTVAAEIPEVARHQDALA
jgi:hypothetical protein